MNPIQFFCKIKAYMLALDFPEPVDEHPDIARMNLQQLADLPMPRHISSRPAARAETPAPVQRCA